MTRFAARLARSFGIMALFLAAALSGTAGGVLFGFAGDLPQISALDDYSPGTITRVLGRDGSAIGEFATERRQLVSYDEIPEVLRQAIIAAEDSEFMTHGGIRPELMIWAYVQDKFTRRRTPGRSTITQQLARQLFPESVGFERTPERKIKEALVALQIEKRYTKAEIFTMYCNKVAWGNRAFGVEAASQLYFGKPAKALTLDEAATIAGILPAPQRLNPYANMSAAVTRRNYTLDRMATQGYISADVAAAAKARPIVTHGQPSPPTSVAPYFLELIRTQLEERYGAKALYEQGLVIRTGLDPALQRAASRALDAGVRRLDKLRGYRRPTRNILDENRPLETYRHPRWTRDLAEGDVVPAIVMSIDSADVRVRVGHLTGTLRPSDYEWTRRKTPDLARRGDVVEVRLVKIDEKSASFSGVLEQMPVLEGAVVAIENRTGQILAMAGGLSFERSQFNRSTQALRQVGSLFKPFVYTAAIDRGYTAQSELDDSPVSFNAGPGQPPYEPRNYDREYHGWVTVREALEGSRNVPTIRLMSALGPREVVRYARQLGISSPLPEYLSVAIGSAEATLLEMTSAYSAFPNQGVRLTPLPLLEVLDREGNILEQHRTQPHEALRADTAYVMTSLLEGVVQHGTAVSARALDWPLGGKTGTTDDYTDAWFIGFDPTITVGVWVGYDQKKPIGINQTGTVAALPIWQDIMRAWIARQRSARSDPPAFERPGNIVTVSTARGPEVFIAGTEPGDGRSSP
jgi:penicillin-binding protein 1A